MHLLNTAATAALLNIGIVFAFTNTIQGREPLNIRDAYSSPGGVDFGIWTREAHYPNFDEYDVDLLTRSAVPRTRPPRRTAQSPRLLTGEERDEARNKVLKGLKGLKEKSPELWASQYREVKQKLGDNIKIPPELTPPGSR